MNNFPDYFVAPVFLYSNILSLNLLVKCSNVCFVHLCSAGKQWIVYIIGAEGFLIIQHIVL